jgi:hypothetical protein
MVFIGKGIIEGFVTDLIDTLSFKWVVSVTVSVRLVQFEARIDESANAIGLIWATNHELDNLGFDVLRSTTRGGKYTKVNPTLISANSSRNYEYVDKSVQPGIRYYYKLVDRNINGLLTEHGPIEAFIQLPATFKLEQSYPNPFYPVLKESGAAIPFQLPAGREVIIRIFNLHGQAIRTLTEDHFSAGRQKIYWDGRDASGKWVSSGIYFYEFRTEDFKAIRRMVLIR